MTWLTPWYAVIAAGIAVPSLVILYFLKLRRRDLEISTTLLWKKAIEDLQANAPFQKLRRNLLLFLQLLVLAAICIALGQPQIKGQNVTGAKQVIMIDRSASMGSIDEDDGKGGKRSRLEAAKKQAIALVESLKEGNLLNKSSADEAMVIAFDTSAEVRQQFTSDKQALKAAIEAIAQTDGPTSIEEAMRLAIAHKPPRIVEGQGLVTGPPISIHIYSDGKLPDADKAHPSPDDSVEYHQTGKADAANLAIIGLRAERNYDDPNKLGVFVAIQNNEKQARNVDVEMQIDGVVAGIRTTNIPAATNDASLSAGSAAQADAREREATAATGLRPAEEEALKASKHARPGVGGVVFQLDRGQGALVQVRLRNPGTNEPVQGDVLPLDDRAWLVVPPAKKMAVALVGRPDLFISSALGGLPLSRLTEMSPTQFEDLSRQGKLGEYDVIILNGWMPGGTGVSPTSPPAAASNNNAPTAAAKSVPLAPPLPPARYLILGAVPPNSGIIDKGKGGAAAVVDWNRDHPILRSVNLGEMAIGETRLVEAPKSAGAEVLANSDSGPIMLEVTTADLRAVVVPFDISNSDWPFKPGFVVFLASAINYLGEDGGGGAGGRAVQPGTVLSDRVPSGAKDISIKLPSGDTHPLTPAGDGSLVYGPLQSTGVYEVSWDGPAGPLDTVNSGKHVTRTYAANLLDPAESDVAAAPEISLANKLVAAEGGKSSAADKKLWPWLLLAALCVVMFEWFIYNRKVYL